MHSVYQSLVELTFALVDLIGSVGSLVLPWMALVAWLVFWLFAVNWTRFRTQITQEGGWIALLLIGFVWIIVWSVVAPPASGSYHLFGLNISNFTGKTVYVTSLFCLMFLAGAAQLSGGIGNWGQFAEPVAEADDHGHGHGHDTHGHEATGHGHDDHGHAVHVIPAHH